MVRCTQSAKSSFLNRLTVIPHAAIRLATGTLHTSPPESLICESGEWLLKIWFKQIIANMLYHLNYYSLLKFVLLKVLVTHTLVNMPASAVRCVMMIYYILLDGGCLAIAEL